MLPSKVKVGGAVYAIEMKEAIQIAGDRNYLGKCSYMNTQIEVLNGLSKERTEETFIHELFHAILYEAGFDEHDEALVERASKVLYQVLKDNPGLIGQTTSFDQVKIEVTEEDKQK